MSVEDTTRILDANQISALVEQLAGDMASRLSDCPNLCLIGIKRRGDVLAIRLQALIAARLGRDIPCGTLDITLYRDDFDSLAEQPVVGATDIPFSLVDRTIVLVDDVLFTGRTVRAALDELLMLGRPARVVLAVLIDRGWRELPIAADFTGTSLESRQGDDVQVRLLETDGEEAVLLLAARERRA